MANKKHLRLNSIRDCHKILAKLINERRRGEIDTSEARDCGYLIKILIDTYEKGELEERVNNIELNMNN
ncbi:MAG: hypothetical protein GTO02_15355 [Candidatus Dadabacteria bacterium]|nr:hypothetical protein [Candidatus Dadabacteria bacterium]